MQKKKIIKFTSSPKLAARKKKNITKFATKKKKKNWRGARIKNPSTFIAGRTCAPDFIILKSLKKSMNHPGEGPTQNHTPYTEKKNSKKKN